MRAVQPFGGQVQCSLNPDFPDQTDLPEHGTLWDISNYKSEKATPFQEWLSNVT